MIIVDPRSNLKMRIEGVEVPDLTFISNLRLDGSYDAVKKILVILSRIGCLE